jgi:hypothetical protein
MKKILFQEEEEINIKTIIKKSIYIVIGNIILILLVISMIFIYFLFKAVIRPIFWAILSKKKKN